MKTLHLVLVMGFISGSFVQGQQAFQDLDFEGANLTGFPATSSLLPGWTAYLGETPQSAVDVNLLTTGVAVIDLITSARFTPIDGNYSVLLIPGVDGGDTVHLTASIAQTGFVPNGSQSLEFLAGLAPFGSYTVSIDGNSLPFVALGSGPNGSTLYGADISAFAGQTATVEFTANSYLRTMELDDIQFSTVSVVPEPSIGMLTALSGLLFGARTWLGRREVVKVY